MVDDSYLHEKNSLCSCKEQHLLQVCVTSTSWDLSLSSAPAAGTQIPHASKLIHNEVMEPC